MWKFGGNVRASTSGKQFARKTSEPFTGSISRSTSMNEKSLNGASSEQDSNRTVSIKLLVLTFEFTLSTLAPATDIVLFIFYFGSRVHL